MAFSGFDDVAISEAYEPPLTTIRIPRRKISANAVRACCCRASTCARRARAAGGVDYELIVRADTPTSTAR